jgi:redox-sensing transcriptional repressor
MPKSTAHRISLYLRQVEARAEAGQNTISSEQLAAALGLTATQVRKDLTHVAQLGRPGVGYSCDELISKLREVLGTDRVRPVALVGCGNLGRALATYQGFERRGFHIAAAFDNDLKKVGRTYGDHIVQDIAKLYFVCQRDRIQLAVLAVPAEAAQDVADQLVKAGVQGILNFAPVTLTVPPHVVVSYVALSMELEQLGLAVRLRQASTFGVTP